MATCDAGPSSRPPKGEKVTILNSKGLNLVGELADTGSRELCILSHGFRSSREDPTLVTLSRALTGAGFSTFRFDFTGNGESEGAFAYGSYWREADDLRSVVNYWRFRGWSVVSLIGHSKGGNAVLLYASKYGDVGSVVNVSGRFDLSKGINMRLGGRKGLKKLEEQGFLDVYDKSGKFEFRAVKSDVEERLGTDMHKACLEIPESCRVLNVHGAVDEIVPVQEAYEFDKRMRNSTVQIVDGADHNFQLKQEEIARLVVEFVRSSPSQPLRAAL
ncbi:hypothetical protein M758_6G142700 [Ceratodon purpureus]|nr:hypothetical protein M758_6G142700 [Ceratodon purpureus]